MYKHFMHATIILCNTNYFDCYIYLDIFVYYRSTDSIVAHLIDEAINFILIT